MHYILKMKQMLEQNYHFDQTLVERHVKERDSGKQFLLTDHVRALIYSLLLFRNIVPKEMRKYAVKHHNAVCVVAEKNVNIKKIYD